MKKVVAFSCVALLCACTAAQESTFQTDATAALSDVQAALPIIGAVPGVPSWFVADVTLADKGLQSILTAYETSGGTVEAASISGAQTAIADFKADLPNNATVQTDAGIAKTDLTALASVSSQSAETQAFTALATLALAVETAEQPASGRMGAMSPAGALISDAHAHLNNLKG